MVAQPPHHTSKKGFVVIRIPGCAILATSDEEPLKRPKLWEDAGQPRFGGAVPF
jgi:hypothetical protein